MFCFPLFLWNLERTEYALLCFSDARNHVSPFISTQPPIIIDILDTAYQVASVVSDPLLPYGPKPTTLLCPHGPQPAKLLCPWGSSIKKIRSGLLCPPPGDLPDLGTEPVSFMSPALAGGFFTNQRHLGIPCVYTQMYVSLCVCVCVYVYHPTCQTI